MGRIAAKHKGKPLSQYGDLAVIGQTVRFDTVKIDNQSHRSSGMGRDIQQSDATGLDHAGDAVGARRRDLRSGQCQHCLVIGDQPSPDCHQLQGQ